MYSESACDGVGVLFDIEPENNEPAGYTFFDCWSDNNDETSPQWDWDDSRSICVAKDVLTNWARSLNLKSIHPDNLKGENSFDHAYLCAGCHHNGYSNIFELVAERLIAAGYSVYRSDTRFEIYQSQPGQDIVLADSIRAPKP